MESAYQKTENESSNKTKKANGGAAQKKAVDSPKYAWERDYEEEARQANQVYYRENAKQREHFELFYKSLTKQKAPPRPDQAYIIQKSALKYEGGTSNNGRATPKRDFYNPQFLDVVLIRPQFLDTSYLKAWGNEFRPWFRSETGKRKRKKEEEAAAAGKRKSK